MKATSIEQIREHLASGGRVISTNRWDEPGQAIKPTGEEDWIEVECTGGQYRGAKAFWRFAEHDWQLLPLEEKEPETLMGQLENAGVRAYYGNGESVLKVGTENEPVIKLDNKPHYSETENGCFTIEWEQNGRCVKLYVGRGYIFRSGTGGEGTGEVFHFDAMLNNREEAAKRLEIWLDWMENDPVDHGTQKGPASVGRVNAESKQSALGLYAAQAGRIEELERELASLYKVLEAYDCGVSSVCLECGCEDDDCKCDDGEPDGTQKGQEAEYIEAERAVHIPVPCEMRLNKRIRTRLLHGQWPEMSDLLSWWEATTGERIEWGRRCERCDGSGKSPDFRVQCGVCQGSGYSVWPTWMNQ